MPHAVEILARCPLFAELPPESLEPLAAIAQAREHAAGEFLFLANEAATGLYIVVTGRVKVYILSPQSGREVVLTTEYPYSTVAELPTFDAGPYPANAQTLEPTRTLFLERDAFERVLRTHPDIALHLLRTLGRRLRRLVNLIESVSFQEVIHRLAAYILRRSETELPFELETNGAIAAQLGTVPELVSRNLSRLHSSGALSLSGRTVTAIDRALLSDIASRAGR